MPGSLPVVSPARAFPLGLGLFEAYLEGRCGQGLSPHCRGVEGGRLCQREVGSKGADTEALTGPAASAQKGEKEAH